MFRPTYFSRLLLPAYDVTEVSEEKVHATTEASRLERSQALLDKFSEHEVEFISCEENGITSV